MWKQHYSIYAATEQVVAAFQGELASYDVVKGTIPFPLSEPVPAKLIGRIAKFRAKEGAEREKAKAAAPKESLDPRYGARPVQREIVLRAAATSASKFVSALAVVDSGKQTLMKRLRPYAGLVVPQSAVDNCCFSKTIASPARRNRATIMGSAWPSSRKATVPSTVPPGAPKVISSAAGGVSAEIVRPSLQHVPAALPGRSQVRRAVRRDSDAVGIRGHIRFAVNLFRTRLPRGHAPGMT